MEEKRLSVLTFGSCGWDRIFEENEDGSKRLIYEEEGRKNSHQAVAAKRAGAGSSVLVSFVGSDEIGKRCLESLKYCEIDTRFVTVAEGESTEINHQFIGKVTKDYTLERFPSPLSDWYAPDMVEQYSDLILNADFVILVSKQPKEFLTAMIEFCHTNGIPTILTISHKKYVFQNKNDLDVLKKCTFIAGNFEEAHLLTKKSTPEEVLKVLPNCIITKGADGVWFCSEAGDICHENSVPVENIVETNGAGDTFAGNFVVFYAEGRTMQESVRMAMCASAIEISRMGVLSAMPFRKETEDLYRKYYKNTI